MPIGIGLSFGHRTQSGTQDTTTNGTTNLSGNQTTTSSQAGTTNTNTTQNTNTNTSGTASGQNTTNQTNQTAGTNRTTGITTSLGQGTIDALSGAVGHVLGGGVTPENIAQLSEMIRGRGDFNGDQFVTDTVDAARNRGEQTLQEQNSAFAARAGGTAETNSMAALLGQRGRNDLESSIANIRAQATAQAEGIQNQNLATAAGAQNQVAGIGTALAEALKGGSTTTDMTQLTDQIASLVGRDTSLNATNQATTGTSTESSTTDQLLSQIAQILTQQRETTSGTEHVANRGNTSGIGASVSGGL